MKKLRLNIQLFGGSLSIVASETDVSVENNTSYINLQIKATTNSTTYNDSAYLKSATITGQNNTYTLGRINFKIGKGQTVTVYNGKIGPFNHNADGTLNPVSISASCYIVSNTQPTASASVTMSTIPRASSITVADANIGSSTNITINKNSSGFTTTLYYKASGQNSWTKIIDKTANQVYGWTVPTSFYALIPNSKTISCQFYADTYNGSTLVGSSSVVTATFTATGNPIINSCTLEATDSTTINLVGSNRMIRYISTIKATVSASGQNSATISSIKVNGVTASGGIATFTNASTYSYQVVVTDSRGYQTSGTYAITWTDYIPLTLNATIVRNQPTDEKIKISYSGNYYNSSFRTSSDQYIANTLSVQYRYREKNGTWGSWTNLSPTTSGNTYSQSNYIISGFDYQKQYEFDIKAIDRVSTKSITGIAISKGQPIYWWNESDFTINGSLNLGTNRLGVYRNIDSDFTNSFKQDIFNNNSTGGLTIIRKSGTWTSDYFPNYSGGLAFMNFDQGGFIIPRQNTPELNVGGVANGVVTWTDKVLLSSLTNLTDWSPTLNTIEGAIPTATYTSQRGKYCRLGNIVFFDFYIRAKITALTGTNNYAKVTGLPVTPTSHGFGSKTCNIGILYSATADTTNMNFVIDGNGIRIQTNSGAGATKWIVTPTSYMEVGGSGWYFVD